MSLPDYVSRQEAITRKLTKYFAGKMCVHGHRSPRWTSTGACIACQRKRPPDPPEAERRRLLNDFAWNADIEAILIDEYVNTGDIMQAREMVTCSAAAYHRHLEESEEFREAIKKATALAIQTLEDRSIHLAGKGNDKLIIATLKAKLSEQYSERVKIDQTTRSGNLSDAELDQRIAKLRGIGGEVSPSALPELPAHPRRIDIARQEARIAALAGGEATPDRAKPN